MRLLFLASSLLDLRKLTHSGLLPSLAGHEVHLATTPGAAEEAARRVVPPFAGVHVMPAADALPGFHNRWLKRLNATAWDQALDLSCRRTLTRSPLASRRFPYQYKMYRRHRLLARLVNLCGARGLLERLLQANLARINQSPEADALLEELRPDAVISTSTNRFEEPAIMARVRRRGVPALTYIHSMDTLSVKGRLFPEYDGYLVWSEHMRDQLHRYFPTSRDAPTEAVGACQYDVLFDPQVRSTRQVFCERHGLRADRPVVLYALGSPRFLNEAPGAVALARALADENPEGAQLLVRPHPQFDDGTLDAAFRGLGRVARVQRVGDADHAFNRRAQDTVLIADWVNSVLHADVVVNTSSSMTVDAALLDTPVVNVNFSPSGDADEDTLIKEINGAWEHFHPLVETGGVVLAEDVADVHRLVRAYLAEPGRHREERRRLAELVCGFVDGDSGARLGEAILRMAAAEAP